MSIECLGVFLFDCFIDLKCSFAVGKVGGGSCSAGNAMRLRVGFPEKEKEQVELKASRAESVSGQKSEARLTEGAS